MIKINVSKWFHFFLIYLLLEYIGGRLTAYFGSIIYAIVILISICCIFTRQRRFMSNSYLIWLISIVYSLLFSVLWTFGELSLGTVLAVTSRFLISWVAICWNSQKFTERLIKISAFLCITSWITFFIVSTIGISSVSWLLPVLPVVKGESGDTISYGIFAFAFNLMDPTRNAGIFGEPGEFQIMINMALYFLLFRMNNLKENTKIKYLAIFFITMVSNLSTTGLINTAIIVIMFLLQNKSEYSVRLKRMMIVIIVAILIYGVCGSAENNYIYTAVINKIFVNGQIDFSKSTGAARIQSLILLDNVIKTKPQSLIFGVGYTGMNIFGTGETRLACAGLITGLMMFGIVTNSLIYGKIVSLIVKMRYSWAEVFCLIFIIINNGMSQPDIMSIFPVIIGAYFISQRQNRNDSLYI